jgi:hypothetical protein
MLQQTHPKAQLTSTHDDYTPMQMQQSSVTAPVPCPKQCLRSSCNSCRDNPNKQTPRTGGTHAASRSKFPLNRSRTSKWTTC